MPFNKKPIKIVITPRQEVDALRSRSSNPKDAFWQPLMGRLRLKELSIDAIEGHTLREFDIAMMHALRDLSLPTESPNDAESVNDKKPSLRSFFDRLFGRQTGLEKPESHGASDLQKAAVASRIVCKTEIDYYSSLGLLMSLEPINEVIKLFGGNFDYFQVFLGSYIPIAFAQAVGDDAFADGMAYDFEVQPGLRNEFSQLPEKIMSGEGSIQGSPTQIGKANWAWVISNTSLVVPVLLAVAIMYVAFIKLNEWAGGERKGFERVMEVQAQMINEDRERFKLLFDELRRKPEPSLQPVQSTQPNSAPIKKKPPMKKGPKKKKH